MIKLNKYLDRMGVLHCKQSLVKVKNFITKANNIYLSRNIVYYQSKSLSDICQTRKQLLHCLGENKLTNYIVFDYCINFSAQVYYNLMCKNQSNVLIKKAKCCLEQDVSNMVSFLEGKNNFKLAQDLPKSDLYIDIRNIELDNKLEIYSYVKNFGKIDYTIVTPGLGSILIGPFFKAVWGNEFINILYSRFKKQDNLISKTYRNFNKDIYLIDDNVGSGFTTEELIELLKENKLFGISSVEYDWYLYDIISKGQSPYTKFKYDKYDKLTLINTRNHKFLDKAIELMINNPNKYIQYLKLNKFNSFLGNEIVVLTRIGKKIAKKYLPQQKYKEALTFTKKIIKTYKGV